VYDISFVNGGWWMTNLSPVEKLLYDFARSQGGTLNNSVSPAGAEIDIDGRKLRILPSFDPTEVVIEVDVCPLSENQIASPELLLALHRLNDEARFAHAWTVTIDDTNALMVSVRVPLSKAEGALLPDWLGDGLERAEMLLRVVQSEDDSPTDSGAAPGRQAYSAIRA
jgi:hypothetical protein